jgi:hypothetical protein
MPIPIQRSRDLHGTMSRRAGVNLAEVDQIGRPVFEEASSRQAQSTQMEMARLRVQVSAAIPDVNGDGFSLSRPKLAGAQVRIRGLLTAGVLSEDRSVGCPPCVAVVRGVSFGNE